MSIYIRHLHRTGAHRVLLKLDISRAFDSVSWPFLLEILRHLGFGQRWREWVSILLSSASTRILVNGSPGPPILHAKGLRQGDPFSPMLFTLVIDALNSLLHHALEAGVLRKLTARHIASSVSLYADDVAIFCHPDASELRAVRALLLAFGEAFGLHTNMAKSSTTPIQCTQEEIAVVTSELACPVTTFPLLYLGLPLSVRKVSASALQPLVDRMAKKLSTWRASMLSRGDRLALVRHVLSAMPTHLMMAMALSAPILKQVNRIIRGFLWHGRRDASAGHCLINWQKVCRPLALGGLGIPDMRRFGVALRTRWCWLQRTDATRPWSHLQIPADADTAAIFRASTTWVLGDGRDCRFWEDKWLEGRTIPQIAPTISSLVPRRRRKACTVVVGLHQRS